MTTIAINPADLCHEAATLQAILLFKQGHPNRSQVFDDLTNVIHYATKLAELKPKSKDEIGIKDTLYRATISNGNGYDYTSPDMDLVSLQSLIAQKIDSIATNGEFNTYDNWQHTVANSDQADSWRINSGNVIPFASGMVFGTAIFNEISATLTKMGIAGFSQSGNTATITTIYNMVSIMEIWDGTQWLSFGTITQGNTTPVVLQYPPTPSGCFTVTIYASNCDGTDPGANVGNSISFAFLPHNNGYLQYPVLLYSPFGGTSLGYANNSKELLTMLNGDLANTNGVVFHGIYQTSLGSIFFASAATCNHLPPMIDTK